MFGQHLMQGIYTTQDGRSDVAISCCCQVSGDVQQCYTAKERRLLQHTSAQLPAGKTLTLRKTGVDRLAGRQTRRFRRVG